jgi:lipoprotein signal peptidase
LLKKLTSLLALLSGIELGIKDYLVDHFPDLVTINPGVAFGLGGSSSSLWGVALLIVLAILQRLRPLHVWLTLIAIIFLNIIERLRFGGAVDYLELGGLRFNLSDIIILGHSLTLIIYWQQKKRD